MKTSKFAIVALLLTVLLAACGGGNSGKDGNSSGNGSNKGSNNQSEASAKPSDEQVTIKYYTFANGTVWDQINEIAKNFENENSNIKVETIQLVDNGSSTDFYKKLDIMSATGDPIDIIQFSHVDFIIERAARGVLAPLNDYLKADNIDPEKQFYVNPVFEGNVYGIQDIASPWLIAINKDALDEAQLPVPQWGWTWDEFREYAKKMSKGEGKDKRYGAYFHTWGEYVNFPAYSELPHPYLTADKKPVFDHESYKQFFEMRRAMEQEDKSVKELAEIVGAKLHYATEFLTGQAAMVPTATFFMGMISDTEKYPHDFQTVFAPLPRSSESAETGSSYIGGNYLSVGATSKHKEESYKFISYMAQQMEVVRDFPGFRDADAEKITDALIGDKGNLIDKESLIATVFDERVKNFYDATYTTEYASQMKKIIEDGFSTFILDKLSIEDAQKQMMTEAQKLIDQSK